MSVEEILTFKLLQNQKNLRVVTGTGGNEWYSIEKINKKKYSDLKEWVRVGRMWDRKINR